ncbi:DNA-methyltransferase [Rhodopirellula sp. MGV]|uniref:DNA-methyltransferase n=1 Tax=Rhodopirellula sp. MGV TaxID=2023130 RepID=UPI000B970230|nr:site-specific DNA-methyltransferase [Rhodopirellula sp. MGV]OYP34959.1 hypothetical protein CGZ80_13135 [Rhodopirellula sp. MGV]PNY38146.1 site-specific DNA-methyltransferase [Rhodopirellula baltica]
MKKSTLAANQVHQGDCVEKLNQLEPGSVDLVFADPPFNIGYTYDVYDDQQSCDDYLQFCREWIGGVHRALKDDGSFWLAIGDEYAAELKVLSQQLGFHCRSWVIWYYTFGVNCVRGFSRSHTHLFYFIKDRNKFTFNGDNPLVRVPSARQLVYADARANPKGRLPDNTWILRPQDAPEMGFSPSHDTWYFARVAGTFKEREGFHGCQMPEQLLGRIIRVSSNPSDLVLDPFGGSGTTLAVAKKLGRRYMGFELSEDYVTRIEQRLDACKPGDSLDGAADPISSAPATRQGKKRTEFRDGRPLIPLDEKITAKVQDAFERAALVSDGDFDAAESKPKKKKKGRTLCHAYELLLNPDRNAMFAEECKQAKLLGDTRMWLEYLLELSRAGKLADEGNWKKQPLKQIDASAAAAEIAFQMMSVDYAMSLDTIMCSPDAATEFEQVASQFIGDDQTHDFRAAIWSLHEAASDPKVTRKAKQIADEFLNAEQPELEPIESFLEQNEAASLSGIYAISDQDSVLFIGQSEDVVGYLSHAMRSSGWQRFSPTTVQYWPVEKPSDAIIKRSLLITWLRPWLNAHFFYQPIATKLF